MSEGTHTIESGLAAATAALGAAMSGTPAPAETTAPPASTPPAPTPQPTQVPATAAAPEPPVPAAAAPVAPPAPVPPVTTELTDPAARRYLEMNGGNVEKALAKAIHDNNRLGALYKEHPEFFRPGAVADPTKPPTLPEQLFEDPPPATPTLAPVELDQNAIQVQVDQAVFKDPEATNLVRSYMANQQQLQTMAAERAQHEQRSAYINQLLSDNTLLPSDDLRRGEYSNELARLEQKISIIESRESRLQMNNDRLSNQFDTRKQIISDYIVGDVRQRAEAEALTAHQQAVEQAEYRRVLTEWPIAIDRCVKEFNIAPEQVEDFKLNAKRLVDATLADPNRTIGDLYTFLAPEAKETIERLDRYHRARAAQYAAGAATRSATPSPATGPGTPVPPSAPPVSPEDAMRQATLMYRQRIRA